MTHSSGPLCLINELKWLRNSPLRACTNKTTIRRLAVTFGVKYDLPILEKYIKKYSKTSRRISKRWHQKAWVIFSFIWTRGTVHRTSCDEGRLEGGEFLLTIGGKCLSQSLVCLYKREESVEESAWSITPGRKDNSPQPIFHKTGSTKSSQHLEEISGDMEQPWLAFPATFVLSMQIEKQNRHLGYIYIAVFKLYIPFHLLRMITFKCLLKKKDQDVEVLDCRATSHSFLKDIL